MGLEDRDYPRERRRREARLGSTSWIDAKARVEHGGLLFDTTDQGFDYRFGKRRAAAASRPAGARWLLLLAAAVRLIPLAWDGNWSGWKPDPEPAKSFPQFESVAVSRKVDPRTATSRLRVAAGQSERSFSFSHRRVTARSSRCSSEAEDDVTVPLPPST